MKHLLLPLILMATNLHAFFSPKMRNNFGAKPATFRIETGIFSNPIMNTQRIPQDGLGLPVRPISPLSNSYLNIESMVMLNNSGSYSDGYNKTRPVFALARLNYDAMTNVGLLTLAYAHATTCKTNFLFFGQVRGYLSVGVAARVNDTELMPSGQWYANAGARVSYNVYNENCALQMETYVFHDQVLVTTTAHRKLGKAVLINGGVDNNRPKVGASLMLGEKCRVSASTRLQGKEQVQVGVNMSLNF